MNKENSYLRRRKKVRYVMYVYMFLWRAGPEIAKNVEAKNVVKPCFTDADCYKGVMVPPGIRGWCNHGNCNYMRSPPAAAQDAHELQSWLACICLLISLP